MRRRALALAGGAGLAWFGGILVRCINRDIIMCMVFTVVHGRSFACLGLIYVVGVVGRMRQ
ncbi:hypothetical protein F5Y09DRAFT_231887 [Xylaria sp. FL1042]|nr:hypothetical protein F5Y09DRAFT_231887 [Xylaria sp. FL1042]